MKKEEVKALVLTIAVIVLLVIAGSIEGKMEAGAPGAPVQDSDTINAVGEYARAYEIIHTEMDARKAEAYEVAMGYGDCETW